MPKKKPDVSLRSSAAEYLTDYDRFLLELEAQKEKNGGEEQQ